MDARVDPPLERHGCSTVRVPWFGRWEACQTRRQARSARLAKLFPLPVARCPLSVVCCLLSVVCCLLSVARCPLFSTNVVSSAVSSFRSRKFLASIHGQTRRLAHGQSPCIGPPGHKSHRGHRGQRGERSALAPRDTRCGPVRPASLQRSRERARQRAGHSPSTTSYQSVISRWTRWGTLSSGWTVTPTRR